MVCCPVHDFTAASQATPMRMPFPRECAHCPGQEKVFAPGIWLLRVRGKSGFSPARAMPSPPLVIHTGCGLRAPSRVPRQISTGMPFPSEGYGDACRQFFLQLPSEGANFSNIGVEKQELFW